MGCIYKQTCLVNQKSYIGKTYRDAETRRREHLIGKGSKALKEAIEEFGEDNFTFEILHDGIIPELLDMYEKEEIAKHDSYHNGYNDTSGGGGGYEVSDETRRRMSEAKKGENNHFFGKKHSDETKQRISEAKKGENNHFFGKKHSDETKQRMSANNAMNRPEARQKVSEATKGKKRSDKARRNISEARKRPEYYPAREFFFSLPSDIELKEKRRVLFKKFTGVPKNTLYRWLLEWTNVRQEPRRPEYRSAREFFLSLPSDTETKEKQSVLRQKFADVPSSTIYRWVREWTKDA